ncbi:chromate transporter [Methylosinus sp. LW4]|uniref:chromate transporter n=1 Tax=Methylosinus sp. LW4 TaxID=136993 RepID=UPI00039D3992|nr:chromate transporter [Methylosinus sp. LW4]
MEWSRASSSNGCAGGLICLAAIYLPSYLLLLGALPFWDALRHRSGLRAALSGVNATVVGILLAALYTRFGRAQLSRPQISGSAFSPSSCWCLGGRSLGWWSSATVLAAVA